uniref:Poly [ADP-ribose] polymerase n=1 Tax=Lates calcarifer TaxID=8187 RepID=A0A4W6CBM8_LATCA
MKVRCTQILSIVSWKMKLDTGIAIQTVHALIFVSTEAFIKCVFFFKHILQLIPVSELTPEYNTVAGYVKKEGLLDRSIVSIRRIQNLDLWEMYCRIQGVEEIQERRLFHGTDSKNVDSICKYNFDVRLAGQHGHSYGKGKCNNSATTVYKYSTSNTKIIFLARVMVGKSTLGKSHYKKPDDGSSENSHNSCVDNIKHPNMFVIFDPNQIYPEYLIHSQSINIPGVQYQ